MFTVTERLYFNIMKAHGKLKPVNEKILPKIDKKLINAKTNDN